MVSLKTILFIPDVHCPYHDARAFNLVEKVALAIKPDTTVIGGDFPDFYAVSSHVKDPSRRMTFDDEVHETKKLLRRVESWAGKERKFIFGNHEDRLDRYVHDRAPEMKGVVDADNLLELTKHGWEVTPYKGDTTIGKLYITHDLGKAGANAVKDAASSYQDNIVINHLHRMIYIIEGNAKGKPHVAACFGWLGDRRKVDYMYKVRANRDWALGFGVGYLEPNGVIHLQPVPIVDYRCVVQGRLFAA